MKKFIAHVVLIFLIPIHLFISGIALLLKLFACWLGDWAKYFAEIIRSEHENQN